MSHNVATIDNQGATRTGDLSIDLSNVINGLPETNESVIKTDGSGNWTSGAIVGPTTAPTALVNMTVSGAYSVGNYPYGAQDNLCIYTPLMTVQTGVSPIYATGSYVPVGTTALIMGYRFAGATWSSKTVILRATPSPYCTVSFVAQWGFGTGALSSFTPIGPRVNVDNTHADIAWGRFVGSGSDQDVSLKIISRTGSGSTLRLANGLQAGQYSIDVKVL